MADAAGRETPSSLDGMGLAHNVRRRDLFLGFLKAGLCGFGGVAPWARLIVVEERKWLTEREYATLLGLGQVLPGPNVVNLCIMIGDRFQGASGAFAALAGIMTAPLIILIGLGWLYDRYGELPIVAQALTGVAAAAAGLVIGTALKMALRLDLKLTQILFGLAAFVGVAFLKIPLIVAVAVLAPPSIALAYRELVLEDRQKRDGEDAA